MNIEKNINLENEINIIMDSKSENEAFARIAIVSFISSLDPDLNTIADIKTAVSEAVTNAIIHGYHKSRGKVNLNLKLDNTLLIVEVIDRGVGIQDIEEARQPLYTSKPEMERSGMGFTIMESFMDTLTVTSDDEIGTKIVMTKDLAKD